MRTRHTRGEARALYVRASRHFAIETKNAIQGGRRFRRFVSSRIEGTPDPCPFGPVSRSRLVSKGNVRRGGLTGRPGVDETPEPAPPASPAGLPMNGLLVERVWPAGAAAEDVRARTRTETVTSGSPCGFSGRSGPPTLRRPWPRPAAGGLARPGARLRTAGSVAATVGTAASTGRRPGSTPGASPTAGRAPGS
ncbi:unnamed protein product, partial [Ixodes persulcatus]